MVRHAFRAGAFVLLVASLLNSRVEVERARRDATNSITVPLRYPSSMLVAALALNYRSAAADLMWIGLVVDFGGTMHLDHPIPEYLIENSHKIIDLDPAFLPIYEWAPAANLNQRGIVSEQDILDANSVVDRGLEMFPDNFDLPYSAAMNFVGFSRGADDARREREIRKALEYLEIAAARRNAQPEIAGNLAWFQKRLRQLEGDEAMTPERRREEIAMIAGLAQTTDSPELKEALLVTLRSLGATQSDLTAAAQSNVHQYEKSIETDAMSWLPGPLWLAVGPEDSGGTQ